MMYFIMEPDDVDKAPPLFSPPQLEATYITLHHLWVTTAAEK